MEQPTLFSGSYSKSSSYLPHCPVETEEPRRRSFLSAMFGHSRSRSADARDVAPPPYSPPQTLSPPTAHKRSKSMVKYSSPQWLRKPMRKETLENALEILRKYDTVILVDDSGSMNLPGSKKGVTRWFEAGQALEALAETAQQYDTDGIDIHFLNSKRQALNMKRLDQLLKPHIVKLEHALIEADGTPKDRDTDEVIKRVNFIVLYHFDQMFTGLITDGEASRLKALKNLCLIQIGVQFVQIGNDSRATRALKELDDDLHKTADIRDIVDTTPCTKLNPVTADGLIKVLLGGINRRIDEQPR
ncbi:hypothetical protein B0H14DRAFT_2937492, partial [Mycena olivaceomarginata]